MSKNSICANLAQQFDLTIAPSQLLCWQQSQEAWSTTHATESVLPAASLQNLSAVFVDGAVDYELHCTPIRTPLQSATLHHWGCDGEVVISSTDRITPLEITTFIRAEPGLLVTRIQPGEIKKWLIGEHILCLARTADEWIVYEHTLSWNEAPTSHFKALPDWLSIMVKEAKTLPAYAITIGHCLNLETPHSPENELLSLEEFISLDSPGQRAVKWAHSLTKTSRVVLSAYYTDSVTVLRSQIPLLTEENLLQWLLARDNLQSLADIVGHWRPVIAELQGLDQSFPSRQFSPSSADSPQLQCSRLAQPDSWWAGGLGF